MQAGFTPGAKGELYKDIKAAARKTVLQRFKVCHVTLSPGVTTGVMLGGEGESFFDPLFKAFLVGGYKLMLGTIATKLPQITNPSATKTKLPTPKTTFVHFHSTNLWHHQRFLVASLEATVDGRNPAPVDIR